MSRLFIFGIIGLLTLFNTFIPVVQASDSCAAPTVNITYDPKYFPEGTTDLTFNFTINDPATLALLNGKSVSLHFSAWYAHLGDYDTQSVTVSGNKFSLTIRGSELGFRTNSLIEAGKFTGELYWQPNASGDYQDFCSQISYQIGATGGCTIGLSPPPPSTIQPNTPFDIKFLGLANTEYKIQDFNVSSRRDPDLASTETGSTGQGAFTNLTLSREIGYKYNLRIYKLAPLHQCFWPIQISATATTPSTPNPSASIAPVVPGAPITPHCTDPSKCTLAGAKPCGTDEDPAIATAIGCIHTNPISFIKDLLTFLVAISGGFAFLLMLVGAFQMISSAGNPERLEGGRDRFTSAIIGLLFVIFATLLLKIIGVDILCIPGFDSCK